MVLSAATFDRKARRRIQRTLIALALGLLVGGCPQEPTPADAGVQETADGVVVDDGQDGSLTQAVIDGEDGQPGQVMLKAVGRAPKGIDVALARDQAASIARRNLLKKLQERGLLASDSNKVEGSAIERIWIDGPYVYAEASVAIAAQPGDVNVPADEPSNPANQGRPPAAATPEGGSRP